MELYEGTESLVPMLIGAGVLWLAVLVVFRKKEEVMKCCDNRLIEACGCGECLSCPPESRGEWCANCKEEVNA